MNASAHVLEADGRSLGPVRGATPLPGPERPPVFGSLFDFARDPLGFMTRCARDHGDVVLFMVLGNPTLLLSEPDAIEQVLVKRHRDFPKDDQFWRHVTAVFGQGLLTSEGVLWRRQRRLAAPASASRPLADYAQDMVRITGAMLSGWRLGETRDLHAEISPRARCSARKSKRTSPRSRQRSRI